MFWGLVLKSNKKYSQTVQKAFHLSQLALDAATCEDGLVQVMLTAEDTTHVLCNLRKGQVEQMNLDLNFAEGDHITFFTKGPGTVHLTGYLIPDEEDFGMGEMDDSDVEEEEDEPVEKPVAKQENGQKKQRQAKIVAEKTNAKEVQKPVSSDEEPDDTYVEEGSEDSDELEYDSDEQKAEMNGAADSDESGEEEEDEDDESEDDDDEDDSEEEDEQPKAKVAKLEPTKSKQNGVEMNGKSAAKEKDSPKIKTLAGGLMVEEVKVGSGKEATKGKKVAVMYEGRLKKTGKVFDATKQAPFKFNLGRGEVIKGWDIGVAGMKVGGKRRLVIPPQLAYGNKGAPPAIPSNSTLVFDVELKNVF